VNEYEYDPEKALWKPNRRGFLSMFIAAAVAPMLPDVLPLKSWPDGFASLRKGDVITISGVFAVNPLSYTQTGHLQQFVITEDCNRRHSLLPICPSIITVGPLQTVSNAPAVGAVMNVLGAPTAKRLVNSRLRGFA